MQHADDAYQIVWLIRRLFRALAQKSDDSLRDFGISVADRAVIEFLYPNEKLSVPEIAERYQVSRQHVQVTVNSLLDAGLLTAITNPRHKRSPLMSLTANGRHLFKKIKVQDTKATRELFSNISDKDRRITQQTLQLLLDDVK